MQEFLSMPFKRNLGNSEKYHLNSLLTIASILSNIKTLLAPHPVGFKDYILKIAMLMFTSKFVSQIFPFLYSIGTLVTS